MLKLLETFFPKSRPPTKELPLNPTGDFCSADHDSTQAGEGLRDARTPFSRGLVIIICTFGHVRYC